MVENVFSILGLSYSDMQISDDALLCVTVMVFIFVVDWLFHLFSLLASVLTRRR